MSSDPLFDPGDELTHHDEEGYSIASFIGRGGTGEVYRLDSTKHGSQRIVKLFLPFYYFDKVKNIGLFPKPSDSGMSQQIFDAFESLKISDSEYATLAELNHPFVVPVHSLVRVQLPPKATKRLSEQFNLPEETRYAFGIIASYVEGLPLLEYAATANPDSLFETLHSVATALDYLNLSKQILHCDIKSDNVLVQQSDGLPVVVDFGLAQQASQTRTDRRVSVSTDLLPPFPLSDEATEIRRRIMAGEDVSRNEFLQEFWPWLDRYQFGLLLGSVARMPQIQRPEREFLDGLARDLGDQAWLDRHASTPLAPYVERANANRVYSVVRTGARESDLRIPSPNRRINVPVQLSPIAQHPSLVRLNRLNQLSLLPARFPGATHSRFLHSLDTYRLTRALSRRLLDRPEFRSLMGEADVVRLLASALLHDVNHLPLLHIVQELADKTSLPDPFALATAYKSWSSDDLNSVLDRVGMSCVLLGAMTRQDGNSLQLLGRPLTEQETFIGSVVSSGVDVDKLSYLQLDSSFSGLGFADGLDIEALFDAATVGEFRGKPVLSFAERGLTAVESVVRARVDGFERLYWCDENRAMMACVLDTLRAVVSHEDGPKRLDQLMASSVGSSDFGFLQDLDRLSEELGVSHFRLASFFDGAWDRVVAVYRSEDPGRSSRLKALASKDRVRVDAEFRKALIERYPARNGLNLVLVDVPTRDLTFSGPVLVTTGATTVDMTRDQMFTAQRERLTRLSHRMTVFVDRDLFNLMSSDQADESDVIEELLDAALAGEGSNWD